MAVGSCNCKAIKVSFSGQPLAIALCHCTDCRKISGSPFTYNFLVKMTDVEVQGSPKELFKVADSGNSVKNYFCPNCGTPLFGGALSSSGTLETAVIRAGIFDDIEVLHEGAPTMEIYTKQRLRWIIPLDGCTQYDGMPA